MATKAGCRGHYYQYCRLHPIWLLFFRLAATNQFVHCKDHLACYCGCRHRYKPGHRSDAGLPSHKKLIRNRPLLQYLWNDHRYNHSDQGPTFSFDVIHGRIHILMNLPARFCRPVLLPLSKTICQFIPYIRSYRGAKIGSRMVSFQESAQEARRWYAVRSKNRKICALSLHVPDQWRHNAACSRKTGSSSKMVVFMQRTAGGWLLHMSDLKRALAERRNRPDAWDSLP